MQCGGVNSRGRSRGVQQGAVHQGAVVTVLKQVISFTGHAALLRLVGNFNLDGVFWVVEINNVNVKDQHSRARDEVIYSDTEELAGKLLRRLQNLNLCYVKLTNSIFSIRHMRRDDDPSLLSCAQTLQGFIHPLDHVSHPDVSVICAVPLVADRETLLISYKD